MTLAIRVEQLCKSHGDIDILKNLELSVPLNRIVAILGPSGAGKSTLLSLLAGLDRPTSGSVEIFGETVSTMSERRLSQFRAGKVGFVFQQFHLMGQLTALENVALPLQIRGDSEAFEKAEQALAHVGLAHRLKHLPHQLSGGECQRVAIARAFVVEPPLIFADEPSGNLDTKTGTPIMELLFDMTRRAQKNLLLVTHNEDLARLCQERFLLVDGKLEQLS